MPTSVSECRVQVSEEIYTPPIKSLGATLLRLFTNIYSSLLMCIGHRLYDVNSSIKTAGGLNSVVKHFLQHLISLHSTI